MLYLVSFFSHSSILFPLSSQFSRTFIPSSFKICITVLVFMCTNHVGRFICLIFLFVRIINPHCFLSFHCSTSTGRTAFFSPFFYGELASLRSVCELYCTTLDPENLYWFNTNNRIFRKSCEICSELTTTTP